MLWVKIGWRNLWRNRRRTYIQLAVIVGSMFLAIFYNSLQQGLYDGMVADGVKGGSGHIGIYHYGYLADRRLADTVPAESLVARLDRDPEVAAALPRVRVPGLLRSSRASRPAAALGLDFALEASLNPLLRASNLVAGTFPQGPNGLAIGAKLAESLHVKVGKKVVWMAQDAHGKIASRLFRISGILRTHVDSVDSTLVLAERSALAELIGRPGSAHEVAVILKDSRRTAEVLPAIEAQLVGLHSQAYRWQQAMPDMAALVEVGRFKSKFTVFVLFVVVAIGTLNTMLMSVTERTREFGMMRSLGISKGSIRKMIVSEALVLSLLGSAIGLALAVLVGLRTAATGIDMSAVFKDLDVNGISFDNVIRTAWDWQTNARLVVGMVLLCLLASLYPAQWALKVRPADAMRTY